MNNDYCQVCEDRSHTPNKKTLKALENIEKGENIVRAKDIKDLFYKLGI